MYKNRQDAGLRIHTTQKLTTTIYLELDNKPNHMAPSTYIGPPTRDVFYKASATDAELRSADAEYADVTDGPVAITLAVEYGARAPSATRCLLTWPVGAAQEGVRILRLLDDEGPARVRLHAATYARHDLVGDPARDAGAHWREWTLGMLDRAQRTLMERLAFLRPNRGIRSQRDWIEGLLNVFCLRGFFLRETVEHCTWFIRAWSQAPEQDLPASDGLLSIEDGEWDDDEGQPIYTADERSPSPMATSSGVSVDGVDSPMEPATPSPIGEPMNYVFRNQQHHTNQNFAPAPQITAPPPYRRIEFRFDKHMFINPGT